MSPGDALKGQGAKAAFDASGKPIRLTKKERDAVANAILAKIVRADARRWKLDELQALIRFCKDAGVRSFRGEGVEFSFERQGRKDDGGI